MIEAHSIEALKQIINIQDILEGYLELRRAGVNLVALCPFHDERTPSFVVSPAKGLFHCYGCGESGDAIGFVMKKDALTFPEAIEKIADFYNFPLAYTKKPQNDHGDLCEAASRYFQATLNKSPNILAYLAKRGINAQSIERFALGYSGESNAFVAFANAHRLPFDKLLEIGLLGKNERGFYAKFHHRVMFPIRAQNGKTIGFGGRLLEGSAGKYINSQQSKIFNKSQILYGYDLAKEAIAREKKIIITEGYIDVVLMAQAGLSNCVATLGTALTPQHLPLLSRLEPEILLCYDGDKAGRNAALKAARLLCGKKGGVVIFKDGKDPADMVSEGRVAEIVALLGAPVPFIEFVIEEIIAGADLENPLEKQRATAEIAGFLETLSPLLKEEYRLFAATSLSIAPHLLESSATKSKSEQMREIRRESNLKNAANPANPPRFAAARNPARNAAHLAEAVIIKSILEQPHLLDLCLDYISEGAFEGYRAEFECILRGEMRDSRLVAILLDGAIISLDEGAFREQLRVFIANIYAKKLAQVKAAKNLDYEARFRALKEIANKIALLKNGTLVRLD